MLDSVRSHLMSQQKSGKIPKSSFHLSMTNSSQKQASIERRQLSIPDSEQKSQSNPKVTLLSDDADEQEVALALGVQHARERTDQLERDSLASSYQDRIELVYQ